MMQFSCQIDNQILPGLLNSKVFEELVLNRKTCFTSFTYDAHSGRIVGLLVLKDIDNIDIEVYIWWNNI